MQIIEFSEFARRRSARDAAEAPPAPPVTDRWAMLHSAEPERQTHVDVAGDEEDFWSDLHFRLAYPTHRMRHH